MMGDDGEKFGAWPMTYEHCWGDGGWVDRCFSALDAERDWLTHDDAVRLARSRTAGRPHLRARPRRTSR